MTPAEKQSERNYRITERIDIMRDDSLDPTPQQLRLAREETDAFMLDLERHELLERVVVINRTAQRDRVLERRFGK
jgi:hypothetical protein